jgi:hypothetical protein
MRFFIKTQLKSILNLKTDIVNFFKIDRIKKKLITKFN